MKKYYLSLSYIAELNRIVPVRQKMNINVGFQYLSTIYSLLVRIKTPVETIAGVYKISFKDCDLVYIRETGKD